MTIVGSDDKIMSDGREIIAEIVPKTCHFQIQGRGHNDILDDAKSKMIVKAFLNHVNREYLI